MPSLIDFRNLAAVNRNRQPSFGESLFNAAPQIAQNLATFQQNKQAKAQEQQKLQRQQAGLQEARELAGLTDDERSFIVGPEGQKGFVDPDTGVELFPMGEVQAPPEEKAKSFDTISRLADPLIEVGTRENLPSLIALGTQFKEIQQADSRIALERAAERRQAMKSLFAALPEGNTAEQNLELLSKVDMEGFGLPKTALDTVDEVEGFMALQEQFNENNVSVTASFRGVGPNGQEGIHTIMSDGSSGFIPAKTGDSSSFTENPRAFAEGALDILAWANVGPFDVANKDLSKEENQKWLSDKFVEAVQAKGDTSLTGAIRRLATDGNFHNNLQGAARERAEQEAEEKGTEITQGSVVFNGREINEPEAQDVVREIEGGSLRGVTGKNLVSELDKKISSASSPKAKAEINFIKAQLLLDQLNQ